MRTATLLLAALVAGCFGDDRGHDPGGPDARDRPDATPRPDADDDEPDAEPTGCETGEQCALDCSNGSDDDGDTLVDCLDPDCDGLAGCELALERTCNDGLDNDGDGDDDCADAQCGWGCAAIANCPATADLIVLDAGDTPMAIPDVATVASEIAVAIDGTVVDVAVRVDIIHTFVGDLDLVLAAPSGATVDLSSDNGSSGDDYTDTVFTDGAAAIITSGTAPFTGEFRPEEALGTLDGLSTDGTWSLEVTDDTEEDTGDLRDVGLALCVAP